MMYMLKKLLPLFLIFIISGRCFAQFISARATHSSGFLSDNIIESDLSKAIGGEIYFSKTLGIIPVNYNLGLDYKHYENYQEASIITGVSFIFLTPSGFTKAADVESVTYTTNKWLNYADLNIHNGVQSADSTYVYQLGGEIGYNVGYVFGRNFFIHGGIGGIYSLIPSYKDTANESSALDLMIKL